MTAGEKIQQLRKEKQLSQEELGNLLLVSRQTVSLWENDQTVPTVDNLIRLKEIFGVSIDSILTGEEPPAPEAAQPVQTEVPTGDYYYTPPIEKHLFSIYNKDLKYIHKISGMPLMKRLVIWTFCLFFSIFVTFTDTTEEQNSYFVFLLAFIFFSLSLIRYIYGLLLTKKNAELVCSRVYSYEIFRNYMLVRIFKAEDEIKTQKIYFNEFTKCWETPYCYFLELKDRTTFIVKKSALSDYSPLRYFCQNLKTDKTDFSSEKITFLKTAGKALFLGCFISFFAAITLSFGSAPQGPEAFQETLQNLRIFHYFIPVPILSIIVGILLNKNKIRNKKNIISGVIIGFLMLIYGFFPAIFGNIGNNLDSVEAQLGFIFPQYEGMNYHASTNLSGDKQSVTTLNFAESVGNEFEEFIQKDDRWTKGSNDAFSEILPEGTVNFPTDFFLIYNITSEEFGELPSTDGEYAFIYIAYNSDLNVAYIYEYTADYKS